MIKSKLILSLFLYWVISLPTVGQSTNPLSFSFSVSQKSRISAGVFTKDGTLIRTLWSGVEYPAGSHTRTWDGLDDEGVLVGNASYDIKILTNTVTYTWEGVIGNSSFGVSQGNALQRGFLQMQSLAITGNMAYYGIGYAEGNPSQARFSLANPQAKIEFFPKGETAQATQFVATDGATVYWAGYDGFSNGATWFIFATKTTDDTEKKFDTGVSCRMALGKVYSSCIDIGTDSSTTISGLAVQPTGPYLFVSHKYLNQLRVFNKTTGTLVQTIAMNAPGALTVDGANNLWVAYGTNSIGKYRVQPSGTLGNAVVSLSGVVAPSALAVSPDNQTLLVADAGTSQQVKAFNNDTGQPVWTFGRAGGYRSDPVVTNDKFYFTDVSGGIRRTFLAYSPDGSFWVGDPGNYRVQHYSSGRVFIDRITYLQNNYSCYVDQANPNRVFAQYLEYAIDYSKPLAANNGSWTLVKNWRASIPAQYFEFLSINHTFITNIFRDVVTMSNGRTYGFLRRFTDNKWVVVELPATGPVRFTGIAFDAQNRYTYHIASDGSLRQSLNNLNGTAGSVDWENRPLIGFDANNDPIWATAARYASAPVRSGEEPINWYGGHSRTGETTSSNIVISFDNGKVKGAVGGGYHLGGIRVNDNKWLWKTAHATSLAYTGDYPNDGAYDVGNQVEYGGGDITLLGRNIFWNYHGEFWKDSQVNKWQHVYDNGLLVGIFGKTGIEARAESVDQGPVPGMGGNVFSGTVVKAPTGNVYLYHAEESGWSGVHRWKIDGLNSIQEQVVSVAFSVSSARGLLAQYIHGRDLNNLNVKTVRVDRVIDFSWGGGIPSGTVLPNPASYSVKWSGFVQPAFSQTYTFYTLADQGVRLWVDGQLLIDRWVNTSLTEYAGTLVLQAGQRYAIRLEYQGGSRVALLWSSSSQPKKVIDAAYLLPASTPDPDQGIDLLDGLWANSVLADNCYGWRRTPAQEDTTDPESKYWTAKTSIKTYGRTGSPDLYAYFRQNVGTYSITRDLGTSTTLLSNWRLAGTVNQAGTFFNIDEGQNRNGGSVIEVLDGGGKVIAWVYSRVYLNQPNTPSAIYGNTKVIAQDEYFRGLYPIVSQAQPLDISVSNGAITIQYGPYQPITTTVYDPTADWQRPKTLRLRFWGNGYNLSRTVDIERMRFYTRTTPSVDLALSLQSNKRIIRTGEAVTFSLRIRNNNTTDVAASVSAQWTCRIPPNLVITSSGLTYANGSLSGRVRNLKALMDTTFQFTAKPVAAGLYRMAAQLTTSLPDPDSTPDSGTADGEDDEAVVDFRTVEPASAVFVSPNPDQYALSTAVSPQLLPDSTKTDLSLAISLSSRTPKLNEVITCSLLVNNAGYLAATGVQLVNQLPTGLQFVDGTGWTMSGSSLTYAVGTIPAGASMKAMFRARVVATGQWTNRAQISQATPADVDSSPSNGYLNGEDDQAQADFRVR